MDIPPLSLSVLALTPVSLHVPEDDDDGSRPLPSLLPVPPTATPYPSLPPHFALSPSPNHPPPYPSLSLGESLFTHLRLVNTSPSGAPVAGVKMMLEVQTPGGRYRLDEVIYGHTEGRPEGSKPDEMEKEEFDALPQLKAGEGVEMKAGMDIKELGQHVMICSTAWETPEGRRTFQRFLKFNVTPPLAIKTRIHTPNHPNAVLSPTGRERVFLEVLVQNTSLAAMILGDVELEPVQGLVVQSRPGSNTEEGKVKTDVAAAAPRSLIPGDTRQFLFVLVPDHASADAEEPKLTRSTFLPFFAGGTILPLGRMDISWVSGPHREPGRLQTSTLNRRVPVPIPSSTPAAGQPFSRSMSAAGGGSPLVPSRTASAIPPSPGQFPSPRIGGNTSRALAPSPLPGPPPLPPKSDLKWEYDLVVLDGPQSESSRTAEVEHPFSLTVRVAIRSPPVTLAPVDSEAADPLPLPAAPPPPSIGVQYLTIISPATVPGSTSMTIPQPTPLLAFSPPSRGATPMSPGPSRVLSPPVASSRPMTPVSSQLRQATSSHIGSSSTLQLTTTYSPRLSQLQLQQQQQQSSTALSAYPPPAELFPPLPECRPPLHHPKRLDHPHAPSSIPVPPPGRVAHLGHSLVTLPSLKLELVVEDMGTTYVEPSERVRRWEATTEVKLDFVALDEGLAELGGFRLVQFYDEARDSGLVAREWESLGDVWVTE